MSEDELEKFTIGTQINKLKIDGHDWVRVEVANELIVKAFKEGENYSAKKYEKALKSIKDVEAIVNSKEPQSLPECEVSLPQCLVRFESLKDSIKDAIVTADSKEE